MLQPPRTRDMMIRAHVVIAMALMLVVAESCNLTETTRTGVLLPIPWREQRNDNNGYCGETSVSSICMYYGSWISPEQVRNMATGGPTQALVDANMVRVLTTMGLTSASFSSAACTQSSAYLVWIKQHLSQLRPVIMVAYACSMSDPDYDHILPAIGYSTTHGSDTTTFYPDDILVANSMITGGDSPSSAQCITTEAAASSSRNFSNWISNRKNCHYDFSPGGCIPSHVDYGIAVKGRSDPKQLTLPTRLIITLTKPTRPAAALLSVGVQMFSLMPGAAFTLIRYNNLSAVRTVARAMTADAFLVAAHEQACTFIATNPAMLYSDPHQIMYGSEYVYRLVNNSGVVNKTLIPSVACSHLTSLGSLTY